MIHLDGLKEQAGNDFGYFLIESVVLNLLLISFSESGRKCNTREKRQIYRTDTITITDRSKLPIREFYTGDVDLANEMTYIRVSHLQCIGLITTNFPHLRSYIFFIRDLFLTRRSKSTPCSHLDRLRT